MSETQTNVRYALACPDKLKSSCKKAVRRLKNEDDCDHFGTGTDSDRPDCLVNSNSCDGPVAVAPGSKVVAAASTFARAAKAYRTLGVD